MSNFERFDKSFFRSLKTQEEKEKYYLDYVKKILNKMDRKESNKYDN